MTLRIAYVCTDPGIPVLGSKGASVHAQAVLDVLTRAGHEVHLVTPRPGPTDHELARAITLHHLPPVRGDAASAREHSARTSDAQVASTLEAIQPDLVYERYALWGRSATAWARAHGVPSILEVNAPLVEEQLAHRELSNPAAAYAVAQAALGAATAVTCVSESVAAWVRRLVPRQTSVLVVPNGVDTERIRPAGRDVRPADDPDFTVGFLGTLKRWHGVDVLIDAMGRTHTASGAAARLLVVGDGPMRRALETAARAAGVEVEFTGAVAPHAVATHLRRMDIACAPYPVAEDHYFSPLKIFEYLAAGLPVIASSVGQIPRLLDHGRLGRLVEPGDRDALADALARLRLDEPERRRLRTAARTVAVARHTWSGVVERSCSSVGLEKVVA